MKILLNPKMKKDKITVIQDSSSDENKENKESLKPQQDYIQEDHPITPEPVQEGHEVSKEKDTPIMEQGMTLGVSFAEEAMKNKQEEDLIFKKLDIPWLLDQDLTLLEKVHMDYEFKNLRKDMQQHKSQIHFLNEYND